MLRTNPFDFALSAQDVAVGTTEHAISARDAIIEELDGKTFLEGAGIDAPLFWQPSGREIDRELHALHLNSLRGGCLVQGLLVGRALKATFPKIRLTEAYPARLTNYLENFQMAWGNEHERDACLAAIAAWAMIERREDWRNRIPVENNAIWMPIGEVEYWLPNNLD
ncbi:MAG: hypothetical protein HY846_06335 [Nitrosomonadales bacterium]|nr:hypothetical protein [Nitrosomonadales bacterium]